MVRLKVNLDGLSDAIQALAREQIPFATSKTINKGISDTRKTIHKVMDAGAIEGGPTQFTKRQLQMNFSDKRNLRASLYFTSKAFYMKELIDGGIKTGMNGRVIPEPDVKKPSSARILTKKGNFRRNYLQQAMRLAGTPANAKWQAMTVSKGKVKPGKVKMGSQGYQVGASKKGVFGLWRWVGKGKARRPELLVYLSRKSRNQRPTFGNAREIAQESFTGILEQNFPKIFGDAVAETLKRYSK